MKKRRVLILTHEDLVPPESIEGLSDQEIWPYKAEYDVRTSLEELGHEVRVVGVSDDLAPLRAAAAETRPHLVFNLLQEFQDVGEYEAYVVGYLELLNVLYTGCNPRGLLLARDKALTKKLFVWHRIPTPGFRVHRRGRSVSAAGKLRFPLIVKSVDEDASWGVSQASVVRSDAELRERVEFVHRNVGTDAIAEEYVAGRELTIGVLGNLRLSTLPVWEMLFTKLPEGSVPIATARAKWNFAYQERVGITSGPAELEPEVSARIARLARRVYRILGLSGYARLDLRLDADGRVWVIEANPNGDLSYGEDLASAAEAGGFEYPALVQRIVDLGLRSRPPWRRK